MGRLFWKFFAVLFLAQMTAIVGVGALFALHNNERFEVRFEERGDATHPPAPPPDFFPREPGEAGVPPGPLRHHEHPGPPPTGRMHIFGMPTVPLASGFAASLIFAALLAWYFSKPIRSLRRAFDAVAQGDLSVRLGAEMGSRRDELADLGRDFDRMVTQLQALMDGQRRLFHDVSHELRSPLARMHAAIGLARQQPERLLQTLDRVEHESLRVDSLVSELLTLARLEAGAVDGEREVIELGEFLDDLLADASVEAEARGVQLLREGESSAQVDANAELLRRAVENVLRNAIRHSPQDGRVSVGLQLVAGEVCVAISDGGPGVPEAALAAIFQPFFRAGSGVEGHGLGLAIAQRVMSSHGGSMSAHNRAQGGLEVRLCLPLAALRPRA